MVSVIKVLVDKYREIIAEEILDFVAQRATSAYLESLNIDYELFSVAYLEPKTIRVFDSQIIDQPGMWFKADIGVSVFIDFEYENNKTPFTRKLSLCISVKTNVGDAFESFEVLDVQPLTQHLYNRKVDALCLSNDLVPFIKQDEYENVAIEFLTKYYPEALRKIPEYIEIDVLLSRLGLTLREYFLSSKNVKIDGGLVLSDCIVTVYDQMGYHAREVMVPANTILIDENLKIIKGEGSWRYNIIHECVHWYLHQKAYKYRQIMCDEDDFFECPKEMPSKDSDLFWIEKHARSIPAYILAPTFQVQMVVKEVLGLEVNLEDIHIQYDIEDAVEQVSETFGLSKTAARLRVEKSGYKNAAGTFNYIDGHYVRKYGTSSDQDWAGTYILSFNDLMRLINQEELIAKLFESRRILFIDNHICINSERYVRFNKFSGTYILTQYALDHPEECFLKFRTSYSKRHVLKGHCILYKEGSSARVERKIVADDENLKKIEEATKLFDSTVDVIKTQRDLIRKSDNAGQCCKALCHNHQPRITQECLADLCDVSIQTVSRFVRENKKPGLKVLVAMCIAMELHAKPAAEFLDICDVPLKEPTRLNSAISTVLELGTVSIDDWFKIYTRYSKE